MSKRRNAWRGGGRQSIMGFLLIVALGLVALYVWRGFQASSSPLVPASRQATTGEPQSPSPETREEFSEAERRGLEEILRQHGAERTR
ncbi:MAG: hypothetical protein U0587_06890 [Candidatus Binatia bacterium]